MKAKLSRDEALTLALGESLVHGYMKVGVCAYVLVSFPKQLGIYLQRCTLIPLSLYFLSLFFN